MMPFLCSAACRKQGYLYAGIGHTQCRCDQTFGCEYKDISFDIYGRPPKTHHFVFEFSALYIVENPSAFYLVFEFSKTGESPNECVGMLKRSGLFFFREYLIYNLHKISMSGLP